MQSWLASVLYRAVDDLAGGNGLRLLMGALTAAIFAVVWRLTRPTNGILVRAGIGALVLGVSAQQWSERPLLIGLLALVLTVLAGEGGLDARWLLPLGWVWVNSHGSFPLGLGYLVVAIIGRRLDGQPSAVEQRCLRWLAGGVALGAINPLGPRILVFPVQLLRRQDVLQHVIEWQAPTFRGVNDRLFLLEVGLAILALVRRPSYRSGLIVVVFLAAALLGQRNVPVAALVLVPILAAAWPDVGSLRSDAGGLPARAGTALALVVVVLVSVARLRDPAFNLDDYPVRPLDHLLTHHVDLQAVRMVAPDQVGNLLELRDGPKREVFYDDRFDMFPKQVSADHVALVQGLPQSLALLDHYRAALVLWPRELPLAAILRADPAWRVLDQRDSGWLLFCHRGADLGGDLHTC